MTESKSKCILLVEDEAILALNEKKQLEKYGYVVKTVTTGEKAVEAVKTSTDIDLILMDINLGSGIDGTQAAEIILKDHDIPIVFLSSHTEPEVVEKTEKITSYGYVVKSSLITVLDASIKMAFKLFTSNIKTKLLNEKLDDTVQNLQIHQVELQMQNEELKSKQSELEALQSKYFNLYEMVPAGYISISETGLVLEANLTASGLLGIARSALLNQQFSSFVTSEYQDIFYLHSKKLFDTDMPQSCELQMRRNDGSALPVYLKAVSAPVENDEQVCHIIIIEHGTENEKEGRS